MSIGHEMKGIAKPLTKLLWLLALALPLHAAAETVEYVHTDSLGTPVAVTDTSGNLIETSEYEPYGKLLNRPLTDGPGFTGHVQDATTGLTYMQQRYYDPAIGRFLSADPITALSNPTGTFNRYQYAANNPYRFTDPDGRCEKTTGSNICGGGAVNNVSIIEVNPASRAQVGQSRGGTQSPSGASAVKNAIPAVVRGEMKKSWTDSKSSRPTRRHEEGGYHGTEKTDGTPGSRRWPTGGGSSITPPHRSADGSYRGLNVEGEWHTHPNPPVDENGNVWTQGGHLGDWGGIRAENYPGDSYIISKQEIYKIDNQGSETVLGPRSDL